MTREDAVWPENKECASIAICRRLLLVVLVMFMQWKLFVCLVFFFFFASNFKLLRVQSCRFILDQ